MRSYLRADLERFLKAVNGSLRRRVEVVVIGGAAAVIHYGVAVGTRDIDTWTTVGRELLPALERARRATGLQVPFQKSGVADAPFDFESRLQRALPELLRLLIRVPERHDLTLMKVLRGDEQDLETITAMHRQSPLDQDLLIKRYREEMGATVIDPARLRSQFLVMIERLFPGAAEAVARTLRRRPRS